jgi:hypothetical protein
MEMKEITLRKEGTVRDQSDKLSVFEDPVPPGMDCSLTLL